MEFPALIQSTQLWWLCAVLPVLFWLAQPPRPRRVLVTAHRAQWLLAQAALRRRPLRFRALRWLLLSLAATCGVLAIAQPQLARGDGPERLMVLLDGSASMARRDDAGAPFARAVAMVREQLANVPTAVAVEVVCLSHGGFRRWSGAAARALAEPGDPGGTLPDGLAQLAAIAQQEPGTAVWVLTDGQDRTPLPGGVALQRIGTAHGNAAITGVTIGDQWPAAPLHLEIEVASFADQPLAGTIEATGAILASVAAAVALAPGQRRHIGLDLQRTALGGLVSVALHLPGDGLLLDDTWSAHLPPLPEPRIAVAADGAGAVFATRAARALAKAVGAEDIAARPGQRVGFLLAEGGIADLPAGSAPMVLFGVAGAAAPASAVWPTPGLVDWARDQPLLTGLDLSELVVEQALRDALPDGTPLLIGSLPGGGTAPLAVLVHGPSATSVHFAFRLQDSNLGLLPALPQILLRAYRLGHGQGAGITAAASPLPPSESDLRQDGLAADVPLPPFGQPGEDLGPWCLGAALLLLALRAGLR